MGRSEQIHTANRSSDRQDRSPRAISAHYDRRAGRVVINLSNRLGIAFDPRDVQGLENATAGELSNIEISPSGFGLHFPAVDGDVYIPSLLEGIFGSERWMASRLGRRGGSSKSPAKVTAARQNGKLGGRPKKRIAAA